MGVSKNDWFIMENPIQMDNLGAQASLFQETFIYGQRRGIIMRINGLVEGETYRKAIDFPGFSHELSIHWDMSSNFGGRVYFHRPRQTESRRPLKFFCMRGGSLVHLKNDDWSGWKLGYPNPVFWIVSGAQTPWPKLKHRAHLHVFVDFPRRPRPNSHQPCTGAGAAS